jgi:transglutaminase-like putative cysteine protease
VRTQARARAALCTLIASSLAGCGNDAAVLSKVDLDRSLLIPIGRSCLGRSEYAVSLNGVATEVERVYDGLGGYWLRVPFRSLAPRAEVQIQVVRRRDESVVLFAEEGVDASRWIQPSALIDSSHTDLVARADAILRECPTCGTNEAKAREIQSFVVGYLTFGLYEGPPTWKASDVYRRRYGVCIDFARLFVGLCRAAQVPARTVEGIVQSREDPSLYDGHHEWAEIMDESARWHPLDLTYTMDLDLSDIRYLDLIYASEENPRYRAFYQTDHRPYALDSGDVVVYSTGKIIHNGFPGLGYELVENAAPSHFRLENTFVVEIRGGRLYVTP